MPEFSWKVKQLKSAFAADCILLVHCSPFALHEGAPGVLMPLGIVSWEMQVADGFNAPVTAGNFIDLVNRKFYDGLTIQRADGFIVQTGDPDGPVSAWPRTTASACVWES